MRQYFKDVRSKMQKDEETIEKVNFLLDTEVEASKGLFVKRKSAVELPGSTSTFRFNFKDPKEDEVSDMNAKMSSIVITQ